MAAAWCLNPLIGVSPGYGIPVYAGRYTGGGAGRVELAGDTLNTAQFGDEPTVFDFPPGLFTGPVGRSPVAWTNAGTPLAGAADKALNGHVENRRDHLPHREAELSAPPSVAAAP